MNFIGEKGLVNGKKNNEKIEKRKRSFKEIKSKQSNALLKFKKLSKPQF